MLRGPDDGRDAFLVLRAGFGSPEACDWTEMLLRMYVRWSEHHGYDARIVSLEPGTQAGTRCVVVRVRGALAYGFLSMESGAHRLTRISPFEASSRLHVSRVLVEAFPDVSGDPARTLPASSFKIEVFRHGAGGQVVNVSFNGVQVTHLPTGLSVRCDAERSQIRCRDTAIAFLQSRLARGGCDCPPPGAFSHEVVRSYVLQPHPFVRDARTGEFTGDVSTVLEGGIDRFIRARLSGLPGI